MYADVEIRRNEGKQDDLRTYCRSAWDSRRIRNGSRDTGWEVYISLEVFGQFGDGGIGLQEELSIGGRRGW